MEEEASVDRKFGFVGAWWATRRVGSDDLASSFGGRSVLGVLMYGTLRSTPYIDGRKACE